MNLAIIGDFNKDLRLHHATNEAVEHSQDVLGLTLNTAWIPTDSIEHTFDNLVQQYQGFWIAPGSPYKSMSGALKLIQYARENKIPTFGTCGGFQHMVIEFARSVMGIQDAEHAEYNPYASKLVVNPLSCSLVGQQLEIIIENKESQTYAILQRERIYEKYYCNFGLNPEYQETLDQLGFRIVGTDSLHEARILELAGHPFFIATLFVPQDNSTKETPHPLVTAFLKAIAQNNKV